MEGIAGYGRIERVRHRIHAVNFQEEAKGILRRYGWGDMLQVMGRTLRLYTRSPLYREFVKRVRRGGIAPDNLNEYFGYGLFVGRKKMK